LRQLSLLFRDSGIHGIDELPNALVTELFEFCLKTVDLVVKFFRRFAVGSDEGCAVIVLGTEGENDVSGESGYRIAGRWYFRASELDTWVRSQLNSASQFVRVN
jgi:hypothetical protein